MFVLVGSDINVAVIEVVDGEVPVATILVSSCIELGGLDTYVLSDPIPCVSTWTVGLVTLLLLGTQS